jgi:hypothetical protein
MEIKKCLQARRIDLGTDHTSRGLLDIIVSKLRQLLFQQLEDGIVDEIDKVLSPKRIKDLMKEIESFQDPKVSYGVCGYAASIATAILQKLLPNKKVQLSVGVFIAPNSMPIWHFYTVIDDVVFLDLTYDQFDHNGQRVLVDKIDLLASKYDIVHLQRGERPNFGKVLHDYMAKRASAGDRFSGRVPDMVAIQYFLRQSHDSLQDLEANPDCPIIPFNEEDPIAVAKTEAIVDSIYRLFSKWSI